MGNQVQKEHIKAAQSQGTAKFAEILDQQLNQFSDSQIHAFLDRVVDQVDSEYEQSPGPEPKVGPKMSRRRTGDSETFKVRKIDHINSLYQMEEKISQGSSCTVMKAREFKTGDVVAGLIHRCIVSMFPSTALHRVNLCVSFGNCDRILHGMCPLDIFSQTDAKSTAVQYAIVSERSGGIIYSNLPLTICTISGHPNPVDGLVPFMFDSQSTFSKLPIRSTTFNYFLFRC